MLLRNLIPHFVIEQFKQGKLSGRFQAASLFVDLSGFTTLTESLMQYQRDGAEVLNEALEAIFSPLVKEVVARGGIIPLFAGDAFAAIFPHDPTLVADAPLQALQVASFIQQFMVPAGQERAFSTKYGRFSLGARVGLAYGDVRWGIVQWDEIHQFYFRGEAVENSGRAQLQAKIGEIVAQQSFVPHLGAHAALEALDDGAYCRLTGADFDLAPPAVERPPFKRSDLVSFVPNMILDMPAKAEFRIICPVFIAFEEPAEERLLHNFIAEVMGLCYRFGGKLAQIDFGDHEPILLLWFGAPVAYENNAERAAEFLLAFQEQLWPIRWRAGISYGTVWAGIRGGFERCEYGAVGDVVNLASRLVTGADWGEIWADQVLWQQIRSRYQFKSLGVIPVKGKRHEVTAFHLLGRQQLGSDWQFSGRMVGREIELSQLLDVVQDAFDGRFDGLMTVFGDAGMGKSRLVYELRRRLTLTRHANPVLWCFCPTDEILRQSLNPFRHFLSQYFEQSAEESPGQKRSNFERIHAVLKADVLRAGRPDLAQELERTHSFLGALLGLHWEGSLFERIEPRLRFENMLRAILVLLQSESLRQPVVIQVEDLHWLDADSLELLRLVVRDLAGYPVAIIGTSRYQSDGSRVDLNIGPESSNFVVELHTLTPAGVRGLASQMLEVPAQQLADELTSLLFEKTGGNPFFLEQVILDLREREALQLDRSELVRLKPQVDVEIPASINAVLIARLDRLLAEVRQVVQAAAVLGREFEIQVLSRMLLSDDGVLSKVKQAEAERIWHTINGMRYIFRHALMRDAAYEMQLRARLRELHHLAAQAIEQVYAEELAVRYADLAYHYQRAELPDRERHYAQLAGREAAQQFANAAAISFFSRALELTDAADLEGRYDLLLAREAVYELQGTRITQEQDLDRMQELADVLDDDIRRTQVFLRRATLGEATANFDQTIQASKQALELAKRAGHLEFTISAYLEWGRALWRKGDYNGARPLLEKAQELVRPTDFRNLEALITHNLAIAMHIQGEWVQAKTLFEQAVQMQRELEDKSGEAMALNDLSIVYAEAGDEAESMALLKQALQIHREIGNLRGEGFVLGNMGSTLINLGEYTEAIALQEQALNIRQEVGDRLHQALSLINLGELYRILGLFSKARECLEEALALGYEVGGLRQQLASLVGLNALACDVGDYPAALDFCQQALATAEKADSLQFRALACFGQARALEGVGRLDEAYQRYEQSAVLRQQLGQPHLVIESQLGMAGVQLKQGQVDASWSLVNDLLLDLPAEGIPDAQEPFNVYLTAHRVLKARSDPRADDLLGIVYRMLSERAAKITDPDMQYAFLVKVPVHREIVNLWRERQNSNPQSLEEE